MDAHYLSECAGSFLYISISAAFQCVEGEGRADYSSVVVRDSRDMMMQHVRLHNVMEDPRSHRPEVAIDSRGSASGEGPRVGVIMRKCRIGVVEVRERDYLFG